MAKMIFRTLQIMPFGTNCYLVASEQTRDGMVIDPAGDAPRIMSNIRELGLKIGLVVLTHIHSDHLGAVSQVIENTGASFAVHTAEAQALRHYDFSRIAAYDPNFKPPPIPDRLLDDGDILVVGDLEFKCCILQAIVLVVFALQDMALSLVETLYLILASAVRICLVVITIYSFPVYDPSCSFCLKKH